ncbi:SDR family oxidoreductase [Rhizobium laguerreae]|uniref:SDR family oxidoreductase n=1 Tax=Rhizobium laguerreae TaxID=1076926 RepID=UPI001C91FC4C|nr:SDR family oxidoreductase [Rhizobium laguerreae]MBY3075468.1 SDR family oxidoreductase [Rhizobium laguerreae]
MRILVTGAAGFVGSAVVKDLVGAGHRVIGLVRSAAAAGMLATLGAEAYAADLRERDSLRAALARADGVIHTAFNHDFSQFRANCEADRDVIEFLGGELTGSDRPLIVTSAIGVLPKHGLVTEATDAVPLSDAAANPRAASEIAADAVAELGVPVSIVRLPPSVHGEGDRAFVPTLIDIARAKGFSAYVGNGENRWPAVHRCDAARLYRLAAERASTHARFHAVAEQGIPLRNIATAIGTGLDLPVAPIDAEAALNHFGWFNHFAAMDIRASSAETRRNLGWSPGGSTLLEDLAAGVYFGGS